MKIKYDIAIICTAYNHGKYIAKTLEGFINQTTDLSYIVYVHDDASTDDTADIIRSYEIRFPNIIKAIYQLENQHSKKIDIVATYIEPIVNARYIAYCEGDDYWTDSLKLQKQYERMESNSSCRMCVHSVCEVDESGNITGKTYPSFKLKEGVISSYDFIKMCESYSFQTSSYFFRAEDWHVYVSNPPDFKKGVDVGDECMLLYYGNLGGVYYINSNMSCYRRGVPTSWSERIGNPNNEEPFIAHHKKMIAMLKKYNNYTNNIYQDSINQRIAQHLFCVLILSKKSSVLVKKENKCYFKLYAKKKQLFVIYAIFFPKMAKKKYIAKLIKK